MVHFATSPSASDSLYSRMSANSLLFMSMPPYKYKHQIMISNKLILSPKRRILLLRVATRNSTIGRGRAALWTFLHSPAEMRYSSVEARMSSWESQPPVTNNT